MNLNELFRALLPLISLVLILVVTRGPQLGIKALMRTDSILFKSNLGFADLEVTKALKITLTNVFGTSSSESFELLYAPAFIFHSSLSFLCLSWLYPSMKGNVWRTIGQNSSSSCRPFFALLGGVTDGEIYVTKWWAIPWSPIIGMSLGSGDRTILGPVCFLSRCNSRAVSQESATISNLILVEFSSQLLLRRG